MNSTAISDEQHKLDLDRLAELRPIDDDFMRELFRNNTALVEFVLRIITGQKDLTVTSNETQYDLQHLLGARSICLDVLATDSEGRIFNIEIQRSDKGASPKRARYHSSAIDVEFLEEKQDFEQLPITYVIFVTENDVRKQNRPIYTFERRDQATNEPFGDDEYIIYINGAYQNPDDNSDIAKLIHDFGCSKAEDMYLNPMAESTRYYKETSEGVSQMCKIVEDMVNEAAEKTRTREKNQIALNFLALGTVSKEDIAKATGLSIEEIQKLSGQGKAAAV
ncbi:MAG: PD-(D/E)XK nuclease family transposase [Ruminococcus sp.]|nr:PD-(D/E)XK nuclease family transposase [Ruminococcus sp.]MCM1381082.1 PD-(D/E)XK nuclease family transposase [Muribaculaceae bacterium]MCM1479274.1 PD-(D/E)XK nuclease family transposase [Muribaculaceae bacterium]